MKAALVCAIPHRDFHEQHLSMWEEFSLPCKSQEYTVTWKRQTEQGASQEVWQNVVVEWHIVQPGSFQGYWTLKGSNHLGAQSKWHPGCLNQIVPVDKCNLPKVLSICLFFNLPPAFLDLKVQMETSNSNHKNMLCLKCFSVILATWTTYVYGSGWSHYSACGVTLFEQDWQSLICPDGADSEVMGPYILEPTRRWGERKRIMARDRSILGFNMSMLKN